MTNDIKQLLNEINNVSRQLLSCILTEQNSIKKNSTINEQSNNDELIIANIFAELISKRENLIHFLFKQNTTEDLNKELNLLNEMVLLDNELSSASQLCKQTLAEHIIKLKKSEKASQSYQKY